MATLSPQPFPTAGLRKLTAKEVVQRAKALNCELTGKAVPSCAGQINIGIFFDGTGNNKIGDYERLSPPNRKHSNIVKLLNAYPDRHDDGYFSYYIPGVGTPFPEIGDSGTFLGGAFAWDGEKRIIWAFTRLLNAVQRYVLRKVLLDDETSARITDNLASSLTPPTMRRHVLETWQETLASNLKGMKPRVELINLSVFGFSRGAAEARAFCNWLFEVCKKSKSSGGWEFAEIPIRLGFLGIFDTVASVGIADSLNNSMVEGHQSWADNNMQIHPGVEQCVHFVAAHEVRAAFALDSVCVDGKYPGNTKEVMYPGAHSDVGGGYAPNALGIAPENISDIARIPGAQMYKEARLAGVPLVNWEKLLDMDRADLEVSQKTARDFNEYIKAAKVASGPVEIMHRQHMSLYLSYRYKYRNSIGSLVFYHRASSSHKRFLKATTDSLNDRMRHLTGYPIPPSDAKFIFSDAIEQHRQLAKEGKVKESGQVKHLYTIADAIAPQNLTPVIEDFLGSYVHDSVAGFIEMGGFFTDEYKLNGLGMLKFRKVFKGND